jgi:hypothetical protein
MGEGWRDDLGSGFCRDRTAVGMLFFDFKKKTLHRFIEAG